MTITITSSAVCKLTGCTTVYCSLLHQPYIRCRDGKCVAGLTVCNAVLLRSGKGKFIRSLDSSHKHEDYCKIVPVPFGCGARGGNY